MTPNVTSSAVKQMDAIPASGKYLVFLHNFHHFMLPHFGLVEQRLLHLRAAAERLLARNPHVIVVYQSAFSVYEMRRTMRHMWNELLVELQRTIMSGLGSRAIFVRTLPITVATENKISHPSNSDQFTKLYMGHICGR